MRHGTKAVSGRWRVSAWNKPRPAMVDLTPNVMRPAVARTVRLPYLESAGKSRTLKVLGITVDGRAWQLVSPKGFAGAREKVYTLDSKTGELRFGDGLTGQRVEQGEVRIKATYRAGGGRSGNVTLTYELEDADRLRLRSVAIDHLVVKLGEDDCD